MTSVNTSSSLSASADSLARTPRPERTHSSGILTAVGYALAVVCLVGAWLLRDRNLIHAGDGLGYWLGIAGTTLMGLLLLYPLRKRARFLRSLGPVSLWFRVHMLFGIVGPLLIVLHSNFRLGSFNGRIALFSTLIVAGSGIVGRYLYAKLHHGLYGRRASLEELRQRVASLREHAADDSRLLTGLTAELAGYEQRLMASGPGLLTAFRQAFTVVPRTTLLRWRIRRAGQRRVAELVQRSKVADGHRQRLLAGTDAYVTRRIAALRKFAQFRAFQSLFALWHVVHYPLFVILVFAVIVHVLAVHMY